MSIKKLTSRLVAIALVAGFAAPATAKVIQEIPTSLGQGADAEVRERDPNPNLAGDFQGVNRGDNREVATRARTNNGDGTFTGTESSASYLKFDLSAAGLTSSADLEGKRVFFRGFTLGNWRAWSDGPNNGPNGLTEFPLRLRALDPNGTYDDSADALVDQNGNSFTATANDFNWAEDEITAFNAPGRTPFCSTQACRDAAATNGEGTNGNGDTLGLYDEFDVNPNVLDVGVVQMPNPNIFGNTLASGTALTFTDPDGALTQLVKDALDAGRETVTLIHHSGVDANNFDQFPVSFSSGLNQILESKENEDNIVGPARLLIVPEPASFALVGLGCLGWFVIRRRR